MSDQNEVYRLFQEAREALNKLSTKLDSMLEFNTKVTVDEVCLEGLKSAEQTFKDTHEQCACGQASDGRCAECRDPACSDCFAGTVFCSDGCERAVTGTCFNERADKNVQR